MSVCAGCGLDNNQPTCLTDKSDPRPKDGDVSICFNCGQLAVFTGHKSDTRPCTQEELDEFLESPDVLMMLMKFREFKEQIP